MTENPSKRIPEHIAIIMDGNGRWAKKRHLPPIFGHREGVKSFKEIVRECGKLGVKYLSVYAFSTENWGRPKEEVDFLMDLFSKTIEKELSKLDEENVKIRFLGRLKQFSSKLQETMKKAEKRLSKNTGLNLNILVSYGSRAEIVDAVNEIIRTKGQGARVEEKDIAGHLYTAGMPDPDLLIRTANEKRISNFLLWQIAYSEIYITPVLWPDFRKKSLHDAISEYNKRERRYGLRK